MDFGVRLSIKYHHSNAKYLFPSIFADRKKQWEMEAWQLEFEWLRIRHMIKDRFGKENLPGLNTILYLIGIQELGYIPEKFSKEEKQDLMHIAVCTLLEPDGYFEFVGRDEEGWPHFKELLAVDIEGVKQQGELLQQCIVRYFAPMLQSSN